MAEKIKTYVVVLIIFFILLYAETGIFPFAYFFENPPAWNPFDYARITDVDYKAVVVDEPNNGRQSYHH